MAEKTREQWVRAVRRWLVVGAVVGAVAGLVLGFTEDAPGPLGSLAFYVPMGAALVLMLWASMYRYDFAKVWGWQRMGLTFLLLGGLMALSIGVGCLQGICGDR